MLNAYLFHIRGDEQAASTQPQTTWATPEWRQDATGWRVQNPDGSYLMNQRHQFNGLWYYMGADGYMLANAITLDGYTVNAF